MYRVYRRDKNSVFRIWLDDHFPRYGVPVPADNNPDLVYQGDSYPAAIAAADRANKRDAVITRTTTPAPIGVVPVTNKLRPLSTQLSLF